MIKVQSLSLRIVLQFAVVLVPLIAVLVYETRAESNRIAALANARAAHQLAAEARDQFSRFVNSAADAVDSGRLANAGHAALGQARARVGELSQVQDADSEATGRTQSEVESLIKAIDADASLPGLLGARDSITSARTAIDGLAAGKQRALDQSIEFAIRDGAQSRQLVMQLSGIILLIAAFFMLQMIRGLSQPLRRAVEIANRIADGNQRVSFAVSAKEDVGGLLQSLQRMNQSLLEQQADVAAHRERLEETVAELARGEESLALAQRTAKLGNWQYDASTGLVRWSEEMHRILDQPVRARPPSLRDFMAAIHVAERRTMFQYLRSMIERQNELSIDHAVRGADGQSLFVHHHIGGTRDASGRLAQLHGTLQDVTDRRRSAEEMRRLALFDNLTGLANRQHFNEHLKSAVAHAKRQATGLAALFIDLDRFKRINDTLGHSVGDQVLREAATRLLGCVRESDAVALRADNNNHLVARLGGDEFIAMLRDLLEPRHAAVVAQRITKALSAPFIIDGRELHVTASVGIAMFPSDGATGDDLVKAADIAMYAAKRAGANRYQFFSSEMNKFAMEKLSLEIDLRQAIVKCEFVLHYQPKVDVATGAIFGTEALIRWNHPVLGLLAPDRFIGLAEELGLIVAIGDWVLEEACRQASEWKRSGLGQVNIAVNLASPSFRKIDLIDSLRKLFERHDILATQIQIEATESMLMDSAEQTQVTLRELRKLGVKLSIDDFGTGYSSLSYLKRFPVDQLKIDRSFISEMINSSEDVAIVAAIISLGRNMNRELVAEGVETLEQARMLRSMGCDIMQGFLFSRPLPAERMGMLLSSDRPFALSMVGGV